MIRRFVAQVHRALGISAGLILVVMGVTGAMMAFEDEIMRALSPGIVTVAEAGRDARLSPDALVAAIRAQIAEPPIASLVVAGLPGDSDRVLFERIPGVRTREARSYVDPYSGRLLGRAHGEAFFETVRALHRWLLLPGDGNGFGRQITGIAALALIYFALSGLWLRWPRRPLDWRQWIVIDPVRRCRHLYRSLHAVVGTWLVVFYLLSALTGLWWSYGWYRAGLTHMLSGETAPANEGRAEGDAAGESGRAARRNERAGGKAPKPAANRGLAPAWSTIQRATGGSYRQITIALPKGDKPLRFRVLPLDARHDRAVDDYRVADDGTLLKVERYADQPLGTAITENILPIHRGGYFGWTGRIVMALSSATLPLFAITGWLLYLDRRRRKRS